MTGTLMAAVERAKAGSNRETSRIVELFGDRYDSETPHMCGANLTDLQVAHQTAMLLRNDANHEAVLSVAKDRIRWLSRQNELKAAALRASLARLTVDDAMITRANAAYTAKIQELYEQAKYAPVDLAAIQAKAIGAAICAALGSKP